jgi:hypothetical protein
MRRALIPWLAKAGLSVFDGGCRTAADTCHAMGTAAAPDGSAVFQLDIAQRAGFFTYSAAHAMGGNSEGLCFDDEPVEGGVDNAGFEPVDGTGLLYGKCLFFPDAGNTSFQCGEVSSTNICKDCTDVDTAVSDKQAALRSACKFLG